MTSHEQATHESTTHGPTAVPAVTGERAEWLETLAKHRHFLRFTTRDLTDEQARQRTTASELCLSGLIKHVTEVERGWADFLRNGASASQHNDGFQPSPDETLANILADYAEAARATDELIATLPDLNAAQPLPEAPWFKPGAQWSARQVLMHIVTETAQHSGHADIIRESLDGARTMA